MFGGLDLSLHKGKLYSAQVTLYLCFKGLKQPWLLLFSRWDAVLLLFNPNCRVYACKRPVFSCIPDWRADENKESHSRTCHIELCQGLYWHHLVGSLLLLVSMCTNVLKEFKPIVQVVLFLTLQVPDQICNSPYC